MRVFVHLGLRTTGALELQRIFDVSRDLLAEGGVCFPRTGFISPEGPQPNSGSLGHAALTAAINSSEIASRANYYRKSLVEELLTAGVDTAVISAEQFLDPTNGLSPERVRAVLQSIGTIHPVIYLRRQDLYADALYLHMLSMADRRLGYGFDRFVRDYLGRTWLDYAALIEPWAREYGDENVVVRSFDDVTSTRTLVEDFLDLCGGVDAATLVVPPRPADRPIRPDLTNILRAVNECENPPGNEKSRVVSELTSAPEWNPAGADDGGSLVEDDLWLDLRDEYSAINDGLIETYVSGPSDRLRFEDVRPPTDLAHQRFTMPEARQLVTARWPALRSSPPQRSIQELVDSSFTPRPPHRTKVGLTALIKAPLRPIQNWLRFHLNVGFDHIALFIDGPPFYDELRSFDQVTVVNCDDEFWRNMLVVAPQVLDQKLRPIRKLGHDLLIARGMDWTAGIDGDELMCGDIHAALTALPDEVESVRVAPAEAVQHDQQEDIDGFESRVFKRKPNDHLHLIQAARQAYAGLSDVTLFGFFGHTQGKSIVRAGVEADFWGSHNVIDTRRHVTTVPCDSAILLHFETRPFDQWYQRWNSKLADDNQDTFISQTRFNQYRRLETAFQGGDDAVRALYDEWYRMEETRIAELEADGLVERVQIPREVFEVENFTA